MPDVPAWQTTHAGLRRAEDEKEGLGLVVAVLTGEQHLVCAQSFFEGVVAGIARGLFEAGARGYLDRDHVEFDTQGIADRLAMGGPGIGGGLQAVVDMNGAQRGRGVVAGVAGEQVQEDSGVQAAGEGDAPGRGVEPGVSREVRLIIRTSQGS